MRLPSAISVCSQKRAVEAQLKDMEEKAALERAAAEAEGKRKQEEMAKKQRELVALKIRNIGKDALKVSTLPLLFTKRDGLCMMGHCRCTLTFCLASGEGR